MRKVLATIVAWGVLAAVGGLAGASTAAVRPALGVDKKTITVGIPYVDLAAIRAQVDIDVGDFVAMYNAVIDDLNKTGINGRKLVPIFAPINPTSAAGTQEACVKLTEDEQVFAAIGFFLGDAPLCYLEQHQTPVVGGTITAALLERAQAPWFTLDAGDDVVGQVVDGLAQDGAFKKGKVGVVAAASDQSVLDDVVLPALKRHDVKVTTAIITAPINDTVATDQEASTIMSRFETDNIKTILAVGRSTVPVADALARTDYRPRLLASHAATLAAYVETEGHDVTVLRRALTGNVVSDFDEPALQKCFGVIEKATGYEIVESPPEGEPDYDQGAQIVCRTVGLFSAIADAAGKKLTVASFERAGMKGSLDVPGSGLIEYNPATHTYIQPVFLQRYDTDSNTLVEDDKPVS